MVVLPKISFINYFITGTKNSNRSLNDLNNKIRENIIYCMKYINEEYLSDPEYGGEWVKLKTSFEANMKYICPTYHSYNIEHKAGRKYNYDYLIFFFDESDKIISEEKLEFKFNALAIHDAPQYVSPMNPSQYLSQPFEDYYYDNYLIYLLPQFGLEIPDRTLYLNTIHSNCPKCMEPAQILYYQGSRQSSKYDIDNERAKKIYQRCNEASRECLTTFINVTNLDIDKLSKYLLKSQENKNYLLYKNGEFKIQTANNKDFIISSYSKNGKKSRYEGITNTGKKINILLRWKNGNGIAYPAFQIS
jgi:hypothetical protein